MGTSETREEKTFRNWINHFGFDPYVNDLYDGLRDGLIILQIMDLIHPGIVNWSRVVEEDQMAKGVQRKYEMLANCNYVITLGKHLAADEGPHLVLAQEGEGRRHRGGPHQLGEWEGDRVWQYPHDQELQGQGGHQDGPPHHRHHQLHPAWRCQLYSSCGQKGQH